MNKNYLPMFFVISIFILFLNSNISSATKTLYYHPELMCCNAYNSSLNLSSENYSFACCDESLNPTKCNACISHEKELLSEMLNRHNNKSRFEIFLTFVPIMVFVSVLLIILILLADKITAVAKEKEDGFLGFKWKKIFMLYTLIAAGIFILFYIIMRIFG